MEHCKVVAFDCDGVLFDTRDANKAYYNRILAEFGKPLLTPEQFNFTHMHTVHEAIAYLFPEKPDYEAAQNFRTKMSYLPFLKDMKIEPHLKNLLFLVFQDFK